MSYRREFRGKRNRASGSEEGDEGEIAGKWFTILPNFTNTLSPPQGGHFPLTIAISETGNGTGLISLLSSFLYLKPKNVFHIPSQFKYLLTKEKRAYLAKWNHLAPACSCLTAL